ncbi:hypothetical protein LSCM1_01620 [Leishmania martiniquensis]|uniref:Uncharacterized protein n=1 Tax=Leishmania martiniquensis TaxID=1580590 RepID=A0A836GAX8_9TRYP|nr:hypothetical protein LSCM1_01620 [Leishmania martiniquensis]
MGYNVGKSPMPQLQLPADYLYNPLYFTPNSNATAERCTGEGIAVVSRHRVPYAVLPPTTYVHRPLHFEPSLLNVTPLRSHHRRSDSREKKPTRRSGSSSSAAVSAQGRRIWLPTADARRSLRGRSHASSQEVTMDEVSAGLDTSLPRSTRAAQLRAEYVHHQLEERDEAAQNIFFLPKGRTLSAAALISPRGQHCPSAVSASCSSILTPVRPRSSGAVSPRTPRLTKAAQLRQRAAVQRVEELERWSLEKAAELDFAQEALESAELKAPIPLKAADRGKVSSRPVAVEHSGGDFDAAAVKSSNGAYPSHHTPRRHTSRRGSSVDAMDDVSRRIRTAPGSASMRSTRRADWRVAALTYYDEEERAVHVQQRVTEVVHAPASDRALDAPAALPSSRHRLGKPSQAAVKALRGEPTEAQYGDGTALTSTPATEAKGKRAPSRHHRHLRSHAAGRNADNLSSVEIREMPESRQHSSVTAAAASLASAVPRDRNTGATPESQITEAKTAPDEGSPEAQCTATSKSLNFQGSDSASSSSLSSSIIFTVSSVPREDISGTHYAEVRHSWQQVPAQVIRLQGGRGDADVKTSQLPSGDRGEREHPSSSLAVGVPVGAALRSVVHVAVSSLVASPIVSRLPSPRNASASVVRDEQRIANAAVAAPAEDATSISSFGCHSGKPPHVARVTESFASARCLEEMLRATADAPPNASAWALGRHSEALPSVDAHPAPAHAPQTASTEHAGDVSRMQESVSGDAHRTRSSALSAGEAEAEPPSRSEVTDRSAQVDATPLPRSARKDVAAGEMKGTSAVAEDGRLERSALSSQSSFRSITSYHAEERARMSAGGRDAVDQLPEGAVLQAELLRHYRTAKSSSAAVESRLESCAGLTPSLQSHARASSHREGAMRAAEDRQAALGQGAVACSSSLHLWNAWRDTASALCVPVPAAASGESDLSRSLTTDVSQMPPQRGLPVPPTNYTHAAAAWEARRQPTFSAIFASVSTALEEPCPALGKLSSECWARRRTSATADAMPPYKPQMDGPVGGDGVNSLHLPNLQESGRCAYAAPSAAVAPCGAVATSSANGTEVGAQLGVAVDEAEASRRPALSLEDAKQSAAVTSAVTESWAVNDMLSPRDSRSRPKRFVLARHEGPTEKGMETTTVSGDNVRPASRVESVHAMQETSGSSPSDTADARTRAATSLPHPSAGTLAKAGAAKVEGLRDAAVLCGTTEASPAARFAKIRGVKSSVRSSVQLQEACVISVSTATVKREDTTRGPSLASSASGGGVERFEDLVAVRLSASLPLSTQLRTSDVALASASAAAAEHGSFSLPATEAEKSPLERSAHVRHAASLSSGGGEEELGEGEPHSHAPTPLQCRLLQWKMRSASPCRDVERPAAVTEAERKRDTPMAQAFSRSDASTRCLSAAAAESKAARHSERRADRGAGETLAMPFSGCANSGPSAGKESNPEGAKRATVGDDAAVKKLSLQSADVAVASALQPPACPHSFPAHSPSASASRCSHSLSGSTSSSLSRSSSLVMAPTATN